jgi:hypothetical protein
MKFYFRPKGGHIHASRDCSMLNEGQFESLGYREYTPYERDNWLRACTCFYSALRINKGHHLDSNTIKELIKNAQSK